MRNDVCSNFIELRMEKNSSIVAYQNQVVLLCSNSQARASPGLLLAVQLSSHTLNPILVFE